MRRQPACFRPALFGVKLLSRSAVQPFSRLAV
jgi:hypothetical protein